MRSIFTRAVGRVCAAAIVLGLAFPTGYAMAESGTFSVVIENDVFAKTDEGYTNGMRFSWPG